MPKKDPHVEAHQEWIGFLQPKGLVVSPHALVRAGAILDRRDAEGQNLLRECIEERSFGPDKAPEPWLPEFRTFAGRVLGWSFSSKGFAGSEEFPIPTELQFSLPEFGEVLHPDYAVREPDPPEDAIPWQLLVRVLDPSQGFDEEEPSDGSLEESPHSRMERLLRRSEVGAGLLFNGQAIRLISAPRGESSGWMDFKVVDMVETSGRPICSAMRLLLSQPGLLTLHRDQRLATLLRDSRSFQNEVSERLAEQVLHALYELLRGFQAAHDASGGELLRTPLSQHPDEVYRSLLTVILRLVFLLYAEERDMLPDEETFLQNYSIAKLYERLRNDASLHPDTMDQRFGAWAQLLVLFRMLYDGAEWGDTRLPRRHGVLFDPDRFPFLEGRPSAGARQVTERVEPPLVPDGTIYRALDKLLVLDGERISYRALDVEQIGSVYETMMGFKLERATGRSISIRAQKKRGAPTTVDLEELLEAKPGQRKKWLKDRTDRELSPKLEMAVKEAGTLEDLHATLDPVIDHAATPDLVPLEAMVLQPSEERRRTGSHYTPRSLTEPIVRTTLEPVLDRLRGDDGTSPTPDQILDLKVCDPAMGSGAFLVEACRHLADVLIEAWKVHGGKPEIPPDEDDIVYARRLIAQRCLYGVDRNPVAVDLSKVSLWLATLAKEHPLTFLDHALRHGDSLVGLTTEQIEAFHWDPSAQPFQAVQIREHLEKVAVLRQQIRDAGEDVSESDLSQMWDEAQEQLAKVRLYGDLVLAAFFQSEKPKGRDAKRLEYASVVSGDRVAALAGLVEELRHDEPPLVPFHWQVEFPEVFDRRLPGFDSIVGNPPFGGKNLVAASNRVEFPDWLKHIHEGSHGNADLVAHFFRRSFALLRRAGTFGLLATNTIAQGDTRATGLRWICTNSGEIYSARKRYKWPGTAAVVVSVVHVIKGQHDGVRWLDGTEVETITAYLFHRGGDEDPARLAANAGKSFIGSYVLGMGFTFDDTDTKGVATPLSEMKRIVESNPTNQEVIFPYIGGQEVASHPAQRAHRYIINFGTLDEKECRERWPELMSIVEEKVRPARQSQGSIVNPARWWMFARSAADLFSAIEELDKVIVISRVGQRAAFAYLPNGMVYAESLVVFPLETYAAYCALQARPHEIWARFFGSSMKDDLRYTPSDCFETFPSPENWQEHPALEAAGKQYYEYRADLMVRNDEGLTKTYNRFHDPEEDDPEIVQLRKLHAVMDRAVLDAYGWSDIPTDCEFLLDYEIDEEEWSPRRKKPYRYRWPDDVHDEVLARLLELNAERAKEEARAGAATGSKVRGRRKTDVESESLF